MTIRHICVCMIRKWTKVGEIWRKVSKGREIESKKGSRKWSQQHSGKHLHPTRGRAESASVVTGGRGRGEDICQAVWLLSLVRLFATPSTAACQASLSIANSWRLPKLISIKSVMPPNHLILCCPLLLLPSTFPRIRVFSMSQFFPWGGQSIGTSTSASVLRMNIQDWFPLGWTGWISLLSKGLSRVFSSTTVQKNQFFRLSAFFMVQLSHSYMTTGETVALTIQTFVS